jgi:hypothetical protein
MPLLTLPCDGLETKDQILATLVHCLLKFLDPRAAPDSILDGLLEASEFGHNSLVESPAIPVASGRILFRILMREYGVEAPSRSVPVLAEMCLSRVAVSKTKGHG